MTEVDDGLAPTPPPTSRSRLRRALRVLFVVAAVGLGAAAVFARRGQIADALRQVNPVLLVLSGLSVLPASQAIMLAWRALLTDLGSPLPLHAAGRIFYLSQLGKYLPGSVWPMFAQMELGREYAVPRRRSAVTLMVLFLTSICSALLIAAVTLPLVSRDVVTRYWWVWLAVPVLLFFMTPRVLTWGLVRAARLLRRDPPNETPSRRGIYVALGWCGVSWLFFGLHLGLVALGFGASGLSVWPLAIGAFALAWAAGFIVVFLPAGAGIREAVIVLSFTSMLTAGVGVLIALVSRVLVTAGDLLLAGAAALTDRHRRSRQTTDTVSSSVDRSA